MSNVPGWVQDYFARGGGDILILIYLMHYQLSMSFSHACLVKGSYTGHTDFVHCVCMKNGSSQFVSGAEDGTVRIWGECPRCD